MLLLLLIYCILCENFSKRKRLRGNYSDKIHIITINIGTGNQQNRLVQTHYSRSVKNHRHTHTRAHTKVGAYTSQ